MLGVLDPVFINLLEHPFFFGHQIQRIIQASAAEEAQRRLKFLTTTLSLTSAQLEQAANIFNNAATAESALGPSMKTARDALSTAVKANDAAAIEHSTSSTGQLVAQSMSIRAKADVEFYQILTKDQQSKFAQMLTRMPGPPPGGGPAPAGEINGDN
jgi:Spy/CpxP family protein refolding chaperone